MLSTFFLDILLNALGDSVITITCFSHNEIQENNTGSNQKEEPNEPEQKSIFKRKGGCDFDAGEVTNRCSNGPLKVCELKSHISILSPFN